MNARQRQFIDAYTGGGPGIMGNATKSAAAAGYKQPRAQGPRLLKNVVVRTAIKERQKTASDTAQLTQDDFVRQCMDIANYYRQHDKPPDSTAVKALELAGKALGFLTDGPMISVGCGVE